MAAGDASAGSRRGARKRGTPALTAPNKERAEAHGWVERVAEAEGFSRRLAGVRPGGGDEEVVLDLVTPEAAPFAVALVAETLARRGDGARLWVLLPVLPMIGVAIALYRATQRADEYGRIVMLECMALGFGVSMIAAMALGFLGTIGEAWTFGGWLVFGAGMTTWGLALIVRNVD